MNRVWQNSPKEKIQSKANVSNSIKPQINYASFKPESSIGKSCSPQMVFSKWIEYAWSFSPFEARHSKLYRLHMFQFWKKILALLCTNSMNLQIWWTHQGTDTTPETIHLNAGTRLKESFVDSNVNFYQVLLLHGC